MDEYHALVRQLPQPFCTELTGLNPQITPFVQEIRMRVGQPVFFTIKGRLTPCIKYLLSETFFPDNSGLLSGAVPSFGLCL